MEENLDLHSFSCESESEPLANLKSLSISNSMNDLANIPSLNNFIEALSPFVPNLSLKNLGFVSPCKASPVLSKGYYLRSCSKSVQEISRLVKDKPGNHELDKDLIGDENDSHPVMSGIGALRAIASNKVSL